jgi:hypothetical protein
VQPQLQPGQPPDFSAGGQGLGLALADGGDGYAPALLPSGQLAGVRMGRAAAAAAALAEAPLEDVSLRDPGVTLRVGRLSSAAVGVHSLCSPRACKHRFAVVVHRHDVVTRCGGGGCQRGLLAWFVQTCRAGVVHRQGMVPGGSLGTRFRDERRVFSPFFPPSISPLTTWAPACSPTPSPTWSFCPRHRT